MIIKQYKAEVESRTQGSRPRPRTQKKSETKVKDSPSKDRPSQAQRQECSRLRPRTKDTGDKRSPKNRSKNFFFQAISNKTKNFQAISKKTVFKNIFQAIYKILTIQKIVLPLSRGQGNFRGLEASRPRTSRCVLEDVFEAKVLDLTRNWNH